MSDNVKNSLKWIEDNTHMALSLSNTVYSVVNAELDENASRAQQKDNTAVLFAAELPLLKNGSILRSKATKTVNNNNIIVSNTCAFDTVSSILMIAYRDSIEYRKNIDNCQDSTLLQFINVLANVGITAKTYSIRADLLIDKLHPDLKLSEETTSTFANCETTACNIFESMLSEYPTAYDHMKCSEPTCARVDEKPKSVAYFTYTTGDGELSSLQDYVVTRTNDEEHTMCGYVNGENSPCQGIKTRTTTVSPIHLFIDVFNWQEGECSNMVSEAVPPLKIELCNIPESLECSGITYHLRGVGCFRRGYSRLRTSIGHYFAVCKRGPPEKWEVFDDLQRTIKTIDADTKVPCEFIVYTI